MSTQKDPQNQQQQNQQRDPQNQHQQNQPNSQHEEE